MNRTLLTVIGTRPQYVKYASLHKEVRKDINEIFVDTGQHYDQNMSEVFYSELGIPIPDYNLSAGDKDPFVQFSQMMIGINEIIKESKPDALFCLGDTNSTLAAALTAAKNQVPVIHLEAGERNFDNYLVKVLPCTIPEESNRVATDHLSSVLLCASKRALGNLENESISGKIEYTGDIMYDLFLGKKEQGLIDKNVLNNYDLTEKNYYFCTIHRAINTDSRERMSSILEAFSEFDKQILFPIHPRTRKRLQDFDLWGLFEKLPHLKLVEPVSYLESLSLGFYSRKIITDSGGLFRESYYYSVPSLYIDDTTAWIDIVKSGWGVMTGSNVETILEALKKKTPEKHPDLFGDGTAVEKTVESIKQFLS